MNLDLFLWLKENIRDHALTLAVVVITIILVYHFVVDRRRGPLLSNKYRQSLFELQATHFLNASQYLMSGQKENAIEELLSAADAHKEKVEAYFALGRLYRTSGEVHKAVGIHKSLIARENLSEALRLQALKELAVDYDKAGLVDKAVETFKDVLKINREQLEVIKNLCRIFEDIADWDQALNYRLMLSKLGPENQSDTISHILIEQSKDFFQRGEFLASKEKCEEALKHSPSVSVRIQNIKLLLVNHKVTHAQVELLELLKEHPLYGSFVFVELFTVIKNQEKNSAYQLELKKLNDYFLELEDLELLKDPSVQLAKVRLLKNQGRSSDALDVLEKWKKSFPLQGEVMKIEHIQLLIDQNRQSDALKETNELLVSLQGSSTRHFCSQCGHNSDHVFWRCPQCHQWETIQFRWKV